MFDPVPYSCNKCKFLKFWHEKRYAAITILLTYTELTDIESIKQAVFFIKPYRDREHTPFRPNGIRQGSS